MYPNPILRIERNLEKINRTRFTRFEPHPFYTWRTNRSIPMTSILLETPYSEKIKEELFFGNRSCPMVSYPFFLK